MTLDRESLAQVCRKYHVRRMSLFGSALRESFSPRSDVDLLVEFEPGQGPGFFGLAEMEAELSELLGRRVDLRTPGDLSDYFRDEVLAEAEVQYGPPSVARAQADLGLEDGRTELFKKIRTDSE